MWMLEDDMDATYKLPPDLYFTTSATDEERYVCHLVFRLAGLYDVDSMERLNCLAAFHWITNYIDGSLFVDEVAKAKVLRLAADGLNFLRGHEADLTFLIDEIEGLANEVREIGVAGQ